MKTVGEIIEEIDRYIMFHHVSDPVAAHLFKKLKSFILSGCRNDD